jgi:uncharacterized protein (DUF433 family)
MVGMRMSADVSLTLNEASYVVGRSTKNINRAVDKSVIRTQAQRSGKGWLRKVGWPELRFLAITGEVEGGLTPAARRKLYAAVRRLPPEAHRLELGVMEFRLLEIDRRLVERLRRLDEVKVAMDESQDGNPVIRGTNVSVYVIAALARGQSMKEVIEDYPELTPAQVHAAVEYAQVYPKPGRPLPTRSFKRMLATWPHRASGTWKARNLWRPSRSRDHLPAR